MTIGRACICFVAHPDDDALWFGNVELLMGFDLKIVATYSAADFRADECRRWTERVDPQCEVLFLNSPDRRNEPLETAALHAALRAAGVAPEVDTLYTHGASGEYGHVHHRNVHVAAMSYFKPKRLVTPCYIQCGTYENLSRSADFHVRGDKEVLFQEFYKSQAPNVMRLWPLHCKDDFLKLERL